MALRQQDLGCEKLYMTMTWTVPVCKASLGFSCRRSLDCSVDLVRWEGVGWDCVVLDCTGCDCAACAIRMGWEIFLGWETWATDWIFLTAGGFCGVG